MIWINQFRMSSAHSARRSTSSLDGNSGHARYIHFCNEIYFG